MRHLGMGLAAVALTVAGSVSSSATVLYRETFPFDGSSRGQAALNQGWDVIRNQGSATTLFDIVEGTSPVGTPISANSGGINSNTNLHPDGDTSGGVNNHPTAADLPDGNLFASTGWHSYLFFTTEVPAGTLAESVTQFRTRMRHSAPNESAGPNSQKIHPALKVGGQWWVQEAHILPPTPNDPDYSIFSVSMEGGLWSQLDVQQLAFDDVFIESYDTAQLLVFEPFDQPKPVGSVEAWGFWNALLTGNNRYDFIEFSSSTPALPGDFDANGVVDGADFLVWQAGFGGLYTDADLELWQLNFGGGPAMVATPEPVTLAMLGLSSLIVIAIRRR